ncbi:hypothetical protein BOX15_Mlig006705g3, partial [Macrostomum lignano]
AFALPPGYTHSLTADVPPGRRSRSRPADSTSASASAAAVCLYVSGVSDLAGARRWIRAYQLASRALLLPVKTYRSRASRPRALHCLEFRCAAVGCGFRLAVRLLSTDRPDAALVASSDPELATADAPAVCQVVLRGDHSSHSTSNNDDADGADAEAPSSCQRGRTRRRGGRLGPDTRREIRTLASQLGLTPRRAMAVWYQCRGIEPTDCPDAELDDGRLPGYADFARARRRHLNSGGDGGGGGDDTLDRLARRYPQLRAGLAAFKSALRRHREDPRRISAMLSGAVQAADAAEPAAAQSAAPGASDPSAASAINNPEVVELLRAFGHRIIECQWLPMLLVEPAESLSLFRRFYYALYSPATPEQLRCRLDSFELVNDRADSLSVLLSAESGELFAELLPPAMPAASTSALPAFSTVDTGAAVDCAGSRLAADRQSLHFLASAFVSNVLAAVWPRLLLAEQREAAASGQFLQLNASVRRFTERAGQIGSRRLLLSSLRHFAASAVAAIEEAVTVDVAADALAEVAAAADGPLPDLLEVAESDFE